MAHTLSREAFQQELHGQRTDLYTLRGAGGLQVAVSNYGARLVQVAVPDGQGGLVDVALGYDSLQGYLEGQLSMGAFIGRWAGRLRAGQLHVPGGCTLQLPTNSGPHHHHGGPLGSRFQVFGVTDVQAEYDRMVAKGAAFTMPPIASTSSMIFQAASAMSCVSFSIM